MRIDAHQQFWQLDRRDYTWLTHRLLPVYRDFAPSHIAPLLEAQGIARTITVQAAPTEAETRFLLATAARTPFVAGVVGWADFEARDAAARIGALAADPLLVGLRPMLAHLTDDVWILKPNHRHAFGAMIEHRLVLDAMIETRHLPYITRLARDWPDLSIVIDHAASPRFEQGLGRDWYEEIARLALLPNVTCKLSGLVSHLGLVWEVEQLQPIFRHLLVEFGAQRLLWGSDWPLLTLTANYERWCTATETLLRFCSEAEKDWIYGLSAREVYLSRGRGRA